MMTESFSLMQNTGMKEKPQKQKFVLWLLVHVCKDLVTLARFFLVNTAHSCDQLEHEQNLRV